MNKKLTYLSSILVTGIFLFLAFASDDDGKSSAVALNASVSFNGTQFIIKNHDTFDYLNAKLEVNDDYSLNDYNLKAGQTYTVGIMQFSDEKGNRFTLMQKPKKFSIWCDLKSGKKGFYNGEWKH